MAPETFTVGRIRCDVVPDGTALYRKETLFSDVGDDELVGALDGVLDREGWLPVPYNPLLVRLGSEAVVLDTGAGPEFAAEWGDPVGQFRRSMEASGVDPDQITVVVISHAHPDHIGGLTVEAKDGRELVFPRARHVISAEECGFWFSGRVPDEFASMAEAARRHLFPVRDAGLLDMVEGEAEIVPGLRLVPAPGHTPGHMVVSIGEPGALAMYLGDAVITEVSFRHPDWTSRLEIDRVSAAKTRRQLLDRAASDKSIVAAFHLAATGQVEATDGGYRLARPA
jgi:glyoxylase-like metal-dependent hydrolase (beta-lactamase superfamily II)